MFSFIPPITLEFHRGFSLSLALLKLDWLQCCSIADYFLCLLSVALCIFGFFVVYKYQGWQPWQSLGRSWKYQGAFLKIASLQAFILPAPSPAALLPQRATRGAGWEVLGAVLALLLLSLGGNLFFPGKWLLSVAWLPGSDVQHHYFIVL